MVESPDTWRSSVRFSSVRILGSVYFTIFLMFISIPRFDSLLTPKLHPPISVFLPPPLQRKVKPSSTPLTPHSPLHNPTLPPSPQENKQKAGRGGRKEKKEEREKKKKERDQGNLVPHSHVRCHTPAAATQVRIRLAIQSIHSLSSGKSKKQSSGVKGFPSQAR